MPKYFAAMKWPNSWMRIMIPSTRMTARTLVTKTYIKIKLPDGNGEPAIRGHVGGNHGRAPEPRPCLKIFAPERTATRLRSASESPQTESCGRGTPRRRFHPRHSTRTDTSRLAQSPHTPAANRESASYRDHRTPAPLSFSSRIDDPRLRYVPDNSAHTVWAGACQ